MNLSVWMIENRISHTEAQTNTLYFKIAKLEVVTLLEITWKVVTVPTAPVQWNPS